MTLPHFEPRAITPGVYGVYDPVHDWWYPEPRQPRFESLDLASVEAFCAFANREVAQAGTAGAVDTPIVEHARILEA